MEDDNKEKIKFIKKSYELKQFGKYKDAIEMLYKALEFTEISEDNVEILAQIGELHFLLNNFDRALDEFKKALSINPKHYFSLEKCYEIHIKKNNISMAQNIAQNMCEQFKTPHSYCCYFNTLILQDKNDRVLEIFNNLDEKLKLDCEILYLISTISNDDKRKLILEKIISVDSSNLQANRDLAEIEFNNHNYNKVIQYCLNVDVDDALILYYLACVEITRNNYTNAINQLIKAIKLDNNEHDFYLDLAKAYMDISWQDEAVVALKKSINYSLLKNQHSKIDEKYFLMGWILYKQNENSKAILNLELIEESSQYYPKAQILIETIKLKSTNMAHALDKLNKYFETEQNNPILLDTLADIYKELKQYSKAIGIYETALKFYPESIYYKLEIIDLLIDDKKYDYAIAVINNLKLSNSNCVPIYNSLARIYYRQDNYEEALNSINIYLKTDKNNPEAYYFRGLILNNLEKYSEAITSIYMAISIKPDIAKYYSQMAHSYCGVGDNESAILYIKEAIELNPDEINYKKQALEYAIMLNDEKLISMFKTQLILSEKIIKSKR